MKARVQFKEMKSGLYMTYEPEISFTSVRGLKTALNNCIRKYSESLARYFGHCKQYDVFVKMNGKQIARTTFSY